MVKMFLMGGGEEWQGQVARLSDGEIELVFEKAARSEKVISKIGLCI